VTCQSPIGGVTLFREVATGVDPCTGCHRGGDLSPMSDRCHSLQGRVMDALAEVVSDRRLATERSARDAALAAHFDLLAERHML